MRFSPPKVVIYDAGYKLATYCFARDPLHFRSTRFVIDSLHYTNHISCNPGFNRKRYYRLLGGVNT